MDRRCTLLTRTDRDALGARITEVLGDGAVARDSLQHPYYNQGLRCQISARSNEGIETPLVDGGAFDWVARLTSNSRAVYVASGLGFQLVPLLFRRERG